MEHQGGETREQGPQGRTEALGPRETMTGEELKVRPRIYVASLADYNEGRLVGTWMDATREPGEIYEDIEAMLATSRLPASEEWAIHDSDGFGPIRLSEYETMETVSRLALGIAEHGPAFAALASASGTDPDVLDRFSDVYVGQFASLENFAQGLAQDLGLEDQLDQVCDSFRAYVSVDYELLGRDLGMDLLVEDAPDGSVYLFDLRS